MRKKTRPSRSFGSHVVLGKDVQMDPDVLIGCLPSRQIANKETFIGDAAILRSGTVIYAGTRIGAKLATGHHVVIREENQIGDEVCIWSHSIIDYGCRIGNRVKLHNQVYLAQYTVVEDDVFIGPGVVTTNDKYIALKNFPGPHIHRGAKIGAGVILLPGIHVGAGSLIGSGSVVTRDIPEEVVAYGNPAQVRGALQKR